MTNTFKTSLRVIMACLMATFALAGCRNGTTYKDNVVPQELKVTTMSDSTHVYVSSKDSTFGCNYELGAMVDFPTSGPSPLTDSIKRFVYLELYHIFDGGDNESNIHIPFDQVCTLGGDNIVTDFVSSYEPLYAQTEGCGTGADFLTLSLIAQTETFVTYSAEYMSCGAGCSYDHNFFTFRKRDGHLIRKIATTENLKRFVKDYPDYSEAINFENYVSFYGLTEDGMLYGYYLPFGPYSGAPEIITIPYSEIDSYLTKEAQELIPVE